MQSLCLDVKVLGEGNKELEIRESDGDDMELDINMEGNEDGQALRTADEDDLDDLGLEDIDFRHLGSILDDVGSGEELEEEDSEEDDMDEEPTEDDLLATLLDTDLDDADLDDILPDFDDDLGFPDDEA